ncbi:Pycsar system effector family protein [Streptomyces sp. NPDC058470]|uniref:Pycsar system effector family protein n=1 Tax=Streptomyces sp. NPDC058470 TaxID=3346515 RepID=UPI0036671884
MTAAPDTMSLTASYDLDKNLDDAVRDTDAKITRTDSKASLLLAFDGVVLAAVVGAYDAQLPFAARAFGAAAALALGAAAVLLLLVVRPRLSGNDRSSFPHWARLNDDREILASLTVDARVARLRVLSQIALGKYVQLRWAIDLILGSLALLAAAAGTALL